MKVKILSFVSVILVLLSFLAVPTLAAVPNNAVSNVNFFDMSAMQGVTAYLVEDGEVIEQVTVNRYEELLYVGFDTSNDGESEYKIIFEVTYAQCLPNYTEVAYQNGFYSAFCFSNLEEYFMLQSCVDAEGLTLEYYEIGDQSYVDFMASYVCFDYSKQEFATYYSKFTFLQNPKVRMSFDEYNYFLLDALYTPYNAGYFITGDNDGSYQQGYNEGYANGLQDGVDQGYQQGYDDGYDKGVVDGVAGVYDDFKPNANVFEYATFQVILSFEGERVYTGSISPDISVGSIDFKRALDALSNEHPFDYAKITATWTDQYKWVLGQFSLGISGTGDMDALKVINGVDNKSYYLEATEDYNLAVRPITFTPDQEIVYPVYVTQMIFDGMEGAFANFALVVGSKDYNNGYNAGYVSGINAADRVIYDQGYNKGYSDGYLKGKNDGLSIAQNGSFTNLFASVVQAPVNVFYSMFEFDILGMNMKSFVMSLFSLCIVIIIVKKIIGI